MRGRLINPAVVEIARIDTESAAYDPIYDELPTTQGVDGKPVEDRPEQATIKLRAQIRTVDDDRVAIPGTALDIVRMLVLTFHLRELERRGLVDATTGKIALNKGDRIITILNTRGKVIEQVEYPPGLYATHVKGQPIGISRTRNIVDVVFTSRSQGAQL